MLCKDFGIVEWFGTVTFQPPRKSYQKVNRFHYPNSIVLVCQYIYLMNNEYFLREYQYDISFKMRAVLFFAIICTNTQQKGDPESRISLSFCLWMLLLLLAA